MYCHSTIITKGMLLYNTGWQYDHVMAVNYHRKKFNKIGPWCLYVRVNVGIQAIVYIF
jgi:hypothetical protein